LELTNSLSIQLGIGPICREKFGLWVTFRVAGYKELSDLLCRRVTLRVAEFFIPSDPNRAC
jgi:hypothetical protein